MPTRKRKESSGAAAPLARLTNKLTSEHRYGGHVYIDSDDMRSAIEMQRMFNLMHLESGIKIDFIVRKDAEYRQIEFARKMRVDFAGVALSIASREDLILSKLIWAKDSGSEMQLRDVKSLFDSSIDQQYLREWAPRLGVAESLARAR